MNSSAYAGQVRGSLVTSTDRNPADHTRAWAYVQLTAGQSDPVAAIVRRLAVLTRRRWWPAGITAVIADVARARPEAAISADELAKRVHRPAGTLSTEAFRS